MDRKRAESQIRLVMVLHRVEARRRDSAAMIQFRDRAWRILEEVENQLDGDANLAALLAEARRELWPDGS